MKPKIRIYDNQFKHSQGGSFGAGDLKITPAHFDWSWDDFDGSNIAVITEGSFYLIDQVKEKIKIALILEPPSISPDAYKYIEANYEKFDYVLTHQEYLLKKDPRFKRYFFGGCWIRPEDRKIYDKVQNISIIASNKRATKGQMLRHSTIDTVTIRKFIDGVYGRGYHAVENKVTALSKYRYSIVIENEASPVWITEKTIDCFMTGTIPLYWGTPIIRNYFDMAGIFYWQNIDDLRVIIEWIMKEPDFIYRSRMHSIQENFKRASQYAIPEDMIWERFLKKIYETQKQG